jgi:hypothetical protein
VPTLRRTLSSSSCRCTTVASPKVDVSLDDAVGFVRDQVKLEPRVGIVLGSGLGGLADELDDRVEIPYSEIPDWPVSTAIGHSGVLVLGSLDGVRWRSCAGGRTCTRESEQKVSRSVSGSSDDSGSARSS